MRQTITVLAVIFVISCFAFGQTKNKRSESDEKILRRLERELFEALTVNNNDPFEKYLSDTFVFFPPFGDVRNKSQTIEMVKYDFRQMESLQRSAYQIQINGSTAVVAYRSHELGFFRFVDLSGQFEWIDIFEKRNGNWQLVYRRGTAIY